MRSDANLKTPFFQAHGRDDFVVNFRFGEMTHQTLKSLGVDAEFHAYNGMGHEAQPEELNALGEWLKARIGSGETTEETKPAKGKV